MRTLTVIGASLVAASIGLGAAAFPAPQEGPPRAGTPAEKDGKTIRRHLEVFGSRDAQIGVSIADLTPEQASTGSGAVVQNVSPDSPAARAGIQAGDIVTTFDGEKVRSARQLARLVGESVPGRTIAATVLRNGRPVEVQLTPDSSDLARFDGEFALPPMAGLERLPEMNFDRRMFEFEGPERGELFEKRVPDGEGGAFEFYMNPGRGRLGVTVQDLTPQLAEYFGATNGALISSVDQDSPAARAGLKAGDVITAINGEAMSSAREVTRAVRGADDAGGLTVTYTRDRQSQTATAKLESREKREKSDRAGRPI